MIKPIKGIKNRTQTGRIVLAMVLILAATLGFVMFTLAPRMSEYPVDMENGVIDLTGFDFEQSLAQLPLSWDYYPGKLFTPDDFANGGTGRPRKFTPEDEQAFQTGTYRTVLALVPGKTYALNAWSLDYSTRIFVDGEHALDIGNVANTASEFVPRMDSYTLPVIPKGDRVEVIIQYANFSHHEGGAMREITFGFSKNINSYAQGSMLSSAILGGALILVTVFYLMLYIGGRGFPNFAFALCCFFLATRNQQFVISLMPMNYNWSIVYRFVYINNICTGMAFLLLVYSMYPAMLPRRFSKGVVTSTVIVTLGLTLISLFVPLSAVARLVAPSYLIFIPAIVCICWIFGKLLLRGRTIDRITATGIAVLFATLFFELLLQRMIPEITRVGLGPFGMFSFAICQMLALGLENADLERLNRMKTEFLQDMSHEMQNPLTVIATGIDFTDDQLKSGGDVGETQEALEIIQDETQRLGRMIRGMVQLAEMDASSKNRSRIDFAKFLQNSANSFRINIERHKGILEIDIAQNLPDVFVEADRFKQVISNLMANATRHTRGGRISVLARPEGSFIAVAIKDTGEGIVPELLPRIFERGVSGRRSTGYGLYLCKTIVEAHGGIIKIDSKPGEGTCVTFTVPVYGGQDAIHESNTGE